MKKSLFFLCLLMCFTLGARLTLAVIEIDEEAVFLTEDMAYSFKGGYNLTGTMYLSSGRLDIDHYYVFNISATGGDCNISMIQLTPTTLEWNSTCEAGVTQTDNYLGNYTHNQRLYINGTYDSTKTPSDYFVYFAYFNGTEDNFLLNISAGVQINVLWKNGTHVTEFYFFATNGTANMTMVNSSPILYPDASSFLGGVSNITVNKTYSTLDDYGNLQFYTSVNNTELNNSGTSFLEDTLYLYIGYFDIMGVQLFWIFLFLCGAGMVGIGYMIKNKWTGFLCSLIGTMIGLIITYYSPMLVALDAATVTVMFGLGAGLFLFGLFVSFANLKA